MRILLDTNLIVHFSNPTDKNHQVTVNALDRLEQQGHELRLVPLIIYEYWVVATRPVENNGLGISPKQLDIFLKDIVALFPLLHDERSIYRHWLQLVVAENVHGKRAHDTVR